MSLISFPAVAGSTQLPWFEMVVHDDYLVAVMMYVQCRMVLSSVFRVNSPPHAGAQQSLLLASASPRCSLRSPALRARLLRIRPCSGVARRRYPPLDSL